eukprot:gnl/TRDRNA2_/TRDRNA2_38231_c0_seq1.p1 gnl/TRDRNA2_/TRDRNA2_38231_c0~~gnl/TRDRNA2_/TRDRNA2_38231_c0_seq1.p1  ORF type:complete len:473 (-),score=61.47 gnl/TRDRNA2_/TRDRNA2_38231_c0_seq1:362-1600(-)
MDILIVGVDVILWCLRFIIGDTPSVAILRVFRLLKLSKTYRVMKMFPELNMILRGLAGALKSIFWGMALTTIILTIYSIVAVQLIHPINQIVTAEGLHDGCERCPRAFESVFQSFLTFVQQIVAGDSWGAVSVPIIEHTPLAGAFFMLVLVSVQLAVLNLILAATVDSASEARKGSSHELAMLKEKDHEEARHRLVKLCKDIDVDQDGYLTLEELLQGVDENIAFGDTLSLLDITKQDIPAVFDMMDDDESGSVDYGEFVEELWKFKTRDVQTMLMFVKHYVIQLHKKMDKVEVPMSCTPNCSPANKETSPNGLTCKAPQNDAEKPSKYPGSLVSSERAASDNSCVEFCLLEGDDVMDTDTGCSLSERDELLSEQIEVLSNALSKLKAATRTSGRELPRTNASSIGHAQSSR